ncbi:hypothetical protein GGF43_006335, partial [Coemansia sp. RSA 2618]
PLATDMTLVSGPSLRARIMDLQPLNDPFIIDNIFKSPKKRRRGLLSWGAMQVGESHAEKAPASANLWDFPRHVRARNRRRSIMGSKYSMSSMKRRRSRPSVCGEHMRSVSDPTSAISPMAPKPAQPSPDMSLLDMSTESLGSLKSRTAKPFIATTPSLLFEPPEPTYQRLHTFPELRDDASLRSSSIYRLSQTFTQTISSTLRGVPGLPIAAGCGEQPPCITASTLRMMQESGVSVTQPAPALLRTDDTIRAQRCSTLPRLANKGGVACADKDKDNRPLAPACVIFDPARRELPQCPSLSSSYEMMPSTRFNMVKNSLDIRQPAPPSAGGARGRRCTPAAREASVDSW